MIRRHDQQAIIRIACQGGKVNGWRGVSSALFKNIFGVNPDIVGLPATEEAMLPAGNNKRRRHIIQSCDTLKRMCEQAADRRKIDELLGK